MSNFKSRVSTTFKSRGFKYGSISIITTAVVLAIIIILNLIVSQLGEKYSLKLDLTQNKLYTLTDTSKKELKKIDKEVTLYALFEKTRGDNDQNYKKVTELLSRYQDYKNIKVVYLDPDKNPNYKAIVDPKGKLDLSNGAAIVVKCGDNNTVVRESELFEGSSYGYSTSYTAVSAEQSLTSAIKNVYLGKLPKVYFTTGHSEASLSSDLTKLNATFKNSSYETAELNLATVQAVPQDASIVIICGPKADFTSEEKQKLQSYIDKGGKTIFLLDPLENNPQMKNLQAIFESMNVKVNNDVISETDSNMHKPNKPDEIYPQTSETNLTDFISQYGAKIMLAKSRSIEELNNKKYNLTITPFIYTSDKAESISIGNASSKKTSGKFNLAVKVENTATNGFRSIIYGNGSFLTDSYIQQYGDDAVGSLYAFLWTISWVENRTSDVNIPSKELISTSFSLTQTQAVAYMIGLIIIVPIIIFTIGGVVWYRRRHL